MKAEVFNKENLIRANIKLVDENKLLRSDIELLCKHIKGEELDEDEMAYMKTILERDKIFALKLGGKK